MSKTALIKSLSAGIALACTVMPVSAVMAQRAGVIPYSSGAFNPAQLRTNLIRTPILTAGNPISVGPSSGPTGSSFQVRTNGNLGGVPIFVTFATRPYTGAPVAFSSRLIGAGTSFSGAVPQFLCTYGTLPWEIHVKLSNGREFNRIGTFTPTNCRR